MSTGIFIIAHAPLASALRQCVLHVFSESAQVVAAFDVASDTPVAEVLAQAQRSIAQLTDPDTLLLTDVVGATPCNVAEKLIVGTRRKLVAGVNLPMLLRAMTYRLGPLDDLVERAIEGAKQGVMQVGSVPPQNQGRKKNGEDDGDHQQ